MSTDLDVSFCAFCGHCFAAGHAGVHVVTFDEDHNYIRCWSR